jgi:hypothetical protein
MPVRKTEAQRAQENLDLAKRIQEKAVVRAAKTKEDAEASEKRYAELLEGKKAEAAAAEQALTDANNRVTFLSSHPSLAETTEDAASDDDVL